METLRHSVHAVSGHYGMPVPVETLQVKRSFVYVPFSTVYGYLESLMGMKRGEFQGHIAVGVLHPAGGYGKVLKKNLTLMKIKRTKKNLVTFAPRPMIWETYYDVGYQIAVRGSEEMLSRLKDALEGKVERFGVLSLGTSEDEVHDLVPGEEAAYWIVPGKTFLLPIESEVGWKNRTPKYGKFALTAEKTKDIPEEAWMDLRVQPNQKQKSIKSKTCKNRARKG